MPGTSPGMTAGRDKSAGEGPPRPTSSLPIGAQPAPEIRTGQQWLKARVTAERTTDRASDT